MNGKKQSRLEADKLGWRSKGSSASGEFDRSQDEGEEGGKRGAAKYDKTKPRSAARPAPTSLVMSGIQTQFPFKPYPSQVALMAKVIKSLQEKQNALLESPTGTGKTLALLVSTLAYVS